MIRFALKCEHGHQFESWFQSSAAFDDLVARNLVTCPECASHHVSKELMAPTVRASRKAALATEAPQAVTNTPDPEVAEAIKKLKDHVEKNSDYVGDRFATEARAMHVGDKPNRAIHGEANLTEVRELAEDGVPALPLPFVPRQKSN